MQPKTNDRRTMKTGTRRGFSLIEVMVALVIAAILAAIAYPSYLESVRKTKRAEGRAALMQAMQQQERYYSQNSSYIAFSSAAPNGYKWFSGDTPASSAYEIAATACSDSTLQSCILLIAKPGTKNVNTAYRDEACGELSLASNGIKGAAVQGAQCW
jgi:type IV pilus assembly protein PilE